MAKLGNLKTEGQTNFENQLFPWNCMLNFNFFKNSVEISRWFVVPSYFMHFNFVLNIAVQFAIEFDLAT